MLWSEAHRVLMVYDLELKVQEPWLWIQRSELRAWEQGSGAHLIQEASQGRPLVVEDKPQVLHSSLVLLSRETTCHIT